MESVIESLQLLSITPPHFAVLFASRECVIIVVEPSLSIAPPLGDVLFARVELIRFKVPYTFLIAPPLLLAVLYASV